MPPRSKADLKPYQRNQTKALSTKLSEQLALCQEHPSKVMFLDIETTGLSHFYDEITLVGWSFDGRCGTLIKGDDYQQFAEDAAKAKALITFNGIRFDLRFLRNEFPEISMPETHVDLMYLCRRVGLTGGQKAIETELGLNFREDIEDVDGLAAVLLWHRYLRGDLDSLEKLILYNRADIAAMGAILDSAIHLLEFESDLFTRPVCFREWSAPDGWDVTPNCLKEAHPELTRAPKFDEIFSDTVAERAKIVGIDLTGSEKRPTGWCLLEGRHAKTDLLSSDDEILEKTFASDPDLVSIDSPLCLPKGRVSVDDSDPGREEFGIMRQCERELKRRGVNVYPSLLPSMQKLTARGINLARALRQKGVPVIESYPGAAQDIMRIPRKGAGIDWLRIGLEEFGIISAEGTDKSLVGLNHDELDAITSALVGQFHIIGLSEALGTEDEPPLIIPELTTKPRPLVVGISGPIAAGKTTVAKIFENAGFSYTRFSLVIDDILNERGMELSRANRQQIGAEIHSSGNQRMLEERTIARVKNADMIVVDGMRFPEDHAFLVEQFGANFVHVYVQADEETRRIRYNGNGEEEFSKITNASSEKAVETLKSYAQECIDNNSSQHDLKNRIGAVVQRVLG